jgi:hypothetical protein
MVIRSDARADITNYITGLEARAPNSFEPKDYNRPGTATYVLLQNNANWTIFRNLGNLGIGNGSVATFGDPASLSSNYTDQYFMGGDVSQAPLDPVRELNLNVAGPAAIENNTAGNDTAANTTGGNGTSEQIAGNDSRNIGAFNNFSLAANNNSRHPTANNSAGSTENNVTEQDESAIAPTPFTPENLTYAAFHPINLGRPVNDLMYEHPFATSISTYCRLVGLATPSGLPVNIGMRCLSYGY